MPVAGWSRSGWRCIKASSFSLRSWRTCHCLRSGDAWHRYDDDEHKVKTFSCLDQFYAMAFARLTYRESLGDIEACLATQRQRLYHLGIRSPVARNTLSNANAVRLRQIFADLAQHLIGIARPLYASEPIGLDLKETVYAFDATTIDLCLSVFPLPDMCEVLAVSIEHHRLPSLAPRRRARSHPAERPAGHGGDEEHPC